MLYSYILCCTRRYNAILADIMLYS